MNDQKARAFVEFARQVAEEEAIWADWHNRVFGAGGQFAEIFPTESEREQFFLSAYYVQIEKLSERLREGMSIKDYTIPVTTASGKFVVRIPQSLHEALVVEAKNEGVSLNQLVSAKLAVSLRAASKQLVNEHSAELCSN